MTKYDEKLSACQYKYKREPNRHRKDLKDFSCYEPTILGRKFCFFHDKDEYAKHEQLATERFEEKVRKSLSKDKEEPLECIGYYLPAINFKKLLNDKSFPQEVCFVEAIFYKEANFSEVTFSKGAVFHDATFSKPAYFRNAKFSQEANFYKATFSEKTYFTKATFSKGADFEKATFSKKATFYKATFFKGDVLFHDATFSKLVDFEEARFCTAFVDFSEAKFVGDAYFLRNGFAGKTLFKYAIFEQPNKVTFDNIDLRIVSFAGSDVTRIRIGDKITWGGNDELTIIEEEWLTRKVKGQPLPKDENVSLELVLSVYRNLRENYEFRLQYDEAGKFFKKEMELKRRYREGSKSLKENSWFRRQFSLIGLYHHLSDYGESIARPSLIGAITIFLSTLFWLTQSNPTLEPHTSTFVGFAQAVNASQWLKAFERSLGDFLPLLSLGGKTEVGMIDYLIKIFGGALTFGLLAIALRRKFERKYTR